jgi:hypothetical protein
VSRPWAFQRPDITGSTKDIRVCKDFVYHNAAQFAIQHRINGNYIGLAAAYPQEIFENFRDSIPVGSRFVNVQNNRVLAQQIFNYTIDHYNYEQRKFDVWHDDILEAIQKYNQFAIFDFDFMSRLKQDMCDKIVAGIQHSAKHKSMLMIWHSIDRRPGRSEVDIAWHRDYLEKSIKNSGWNILDSRYYSYYEGYHMRVDVHIIKHRR